MSDILREKTNNRVEWICINEGVNHETTLQILRRTDRALHTFGDVFLVCLLAGTNDARAGTPIELFRSLYRQLLIRILVPRKDRGEVMHLFPATIPIPQSGFGHLPYKKECLSRAREINCVIIDLAEELNLKENLVRLDDLPTELFVDSVHFNDEGCREVAKRFATKILERSA